MSDFVVDTKRLTLRGALAMIEAAIAKAESMGVPQCIVVVDASGEVLSSVRMDGAKFLSLITASAKARTAASNNAPTGAVGNEQALAVSITTGGAMTVLKGGLPVRFGGMLTGAIGVGSGTGEQDIEVGQAALIAVGADAL